MNIESDSQGELFQYFLTEAPELLEVIEETLLSLIEEKTVDKVHTLMRSAHTLKGSAASVEQETIQTIAHHLEDVFQALYPDELDIDPELGTLLLQGYDCLRTPLSATLSNLPYDENAILEQTAAVFAELQSKLGDFFGREAPIPTSEELGFDVVGSIFKDSIVQDLENLEAVIASQDIQEIENVLRSQAEFFMDLGTSYNLPGLAEIAQTAISAIEQNNDSILEIAVAALDNFHQARTDILAGDRDRGGEVSPQLQNWGQTNTSPTPEEDIFSLEPLEDSSELTGIFSVEVVDSVPASLESELESVELTIDSVPASLESELESVELTIDSATASLESEAKLELTETITAETNSKQEEHLNNSEQIVPVKPEREPIQVAAEYTIKPTSILERILQSITVDATPVANPENTKPIEVATPSRAKKTSSSVLPTIRVAIEQLDRLNHTVGELFIKENQQNLQHERLQLLVQETFQEFHSCKQQVFQLSNWSEQQKRDYKRKQRRHRHNQRVAAREIFSDNYLTSRTLATPSSSIESGFDPLEMDVYSDLDIMLQSLTENIVQLGDKIEVVERILQQSHLDVSKRKQLLDRAQEELFQARMLPLSTVLNRFPRHLQQMVATHKKPAQLKTIGSEVTIDKAIAEKLYEPLLHLIRNAYDHGLEAPEIRRQQNKPEAGTITIRAYNQGNRTIIQVGDDGNGINWERVLTKAIDNQLLSPTEIANISEAQLADVLFQPGFSTAQTVTDLSGRGVGLDVVKSQLEALDGSISVRSKQGKGTTFILQLPLNLTTARLLLCQAKDITYALLSTEIERVLSPLPEEIQHQPSMTEEGIKSFWRCQQGGNMELIPICPIEDFIHYQYPVVSQSNFPLGTFAPKKNQARHNPLLLIQTEGKKLCLEVERILVEQELVIKSLKSLAILPSYIQGYSVLGDSNLSLVINPIELVAHAYSSQILNPAKQSLSLNSPNQQILTETTILSKTEKIATGNLAKNIQILVVEDSIVQRQSLVMNLEKSGYQAIQAGNGQEAIAKLNQYPEICLVICDIEMPVMNGFEFLSYCQKSSKFSHIPIAMVTTRSGQKHRQLALSLGAKSYITKPASDRQLVEVISELLSQPETKS